MGNEASLVMSPLPQGLVASTKHVYTNATLIVTQKVILLTHTHKHTHMTVIITEMETMCLRENWKRGDRETQEELEEVENDVKTVHIRN